ncbi:unnamed protein product [Rotaria sp. Silwood2]|nr:unnamed protein product [Rotaria sp. Silwood2]CAF3075676.1 unnamed protein product [Rotaria sp. Silwood2]CAF3180746.1 unnamed protein product [Rotaria sp. Silwood2]CAF4280430.1 unnamed protein product [Rotaria sp. Silwood2]
MKAFFRSCLRYHNMNYTLYNSLPNTCEPSKDASAHLYERHVASVHEQFRLLFLLLNRPFLLDFVSPNREFRHPYRSRRTPRNLLLVWLRRILTHPKLSAFRSRH